MQIYSSDRKNQADDKITKASKRYKKYASKTKGDYGDVEHQPDLRSENRGITMEDLLLNIIHEAKMFGGDAPVKCNVCGGSHHPAAKHTARALAPENNMKEAERPSPDELEKATLCKKNPDGTEVLDEKPVNEGKTKKGPKWNGNSMTIKTTQADINRKSAAAIGQPPPKKIIKSKMEKGEKHKKKWQEFTESVMLESHEEVLKSHGYKPTDSLDGEWKRYEHKDTSHVNVKTSGGNAGDWEHKGKNKSLVATKGDSHQSLDRHLKKVASRARSAANAKDKDSALRSLGLTKVKGARGGTYWE